LPALTDEVALLVVLLLSIANGSALAPSEDPVFCVDDDDFEFVSDWIASSALDTAPSANNIARLQPMRHAAANFLTEIQQASCQREKLNEIRIYCASDAPETPAIHAGGGRNFRPQEAHRPCIARLRGPC
jgi:hypothetical protein